MPNHIMQFSEIEQILIYLTGLGGSFRVRFRESSSSRRRDHNHSDDDDEYDDRCSLNDHQHALQFVENFFRRQNEFEGEVVSVLWKDHNGNRVKIYCRYFDASMRTERMELVQQVHQILREQPNFCSLTATIELGA